MTIQIAREETRCRQYMDYFLLVARIFNMHHRTDNIARQLLYQSLYTDGNKYMNKWMFNDTPTQK